MKITSPVYRNRGRLVKSVSNKLIQDYWKEEILLHPEIKSLIPIGKAIGVKQRFLKII